MAAVLVLTLDVLWGVFSRYFLGEQTRWTEELARVLLIWIALLGAAVAFSLKAHLGVDFFVGLMPPAPRRLMRIVVHLIVIAFTLSVMVWGGIRLVAETFRLEQMMMALPFAKGFVYLAVPISGLFIILFTVEMLIEDWRGKPEQPPDGNA
jgi:TRAP-type C4-dicarboxylate transport system permease small subunit